jgi:hypothetical protein
MSTPVPCAYIEPKFSLRIGMCTIRLKCTSCGHDLPNLHVVNAKQRGQSQSLGQRLVAKPSTHVDLPDIDRMTHAVLELHSLKMPKPATGQPL